MKKTSENRKLKIEIPSVALSMFVILFAAVVAWAEPPVHDMQAVVRGYYHLDSYAELLTDGELTLTPEGPSQITGYATVNVSTNAERIYLCVQASDLHHIWDPTEPPIPFDVGLEMRIETDVHDVSAPAIYEWADASGQQYRTEYELFERPGGWEWTPVQLVGHWLRADQGGQPGDYEGIMILYLMHFESEF